MFLKAAVLFALLALGGGQFAGCDSAALNACTLQYFIQPLNYPITNNVQVWLDYSTFLNFTDQLITQNVGDPSGLVTICNALELTNGCTSSVTQYPYECFSNYAFLMRGADQTTAATFAGLINLYGFRCSAGLYTLLRENLSCVQRTLWQYRSVLWGCLNTYQVNVQHNPGGACTYVNDYASCYSTVFNQTACGFAGSADHWWACEGAYQFTQAAYPTCYVPCSRETGGPNNFEQYLAEHVKVENAEKWFKLPNIWQQVDGGWKFVENVWMTRD